MNIVIDLLATQLRETNRSHHLLHLQFLDRNCFQICGIAWFKNLLFTLIVHNFYQYCEFYLAAKMVEFYLAEWLYNITDVKII